MATTTDNPVHELLSLPGMTQPMLAKLTGFSPRTVAHWKDGQGLTDRAVRSIGEIEDLVRQLQRHVKPEAVVPWLKRPVPGLDGQRPIHLIESGRIGDVFRLLALLDAGPAT